MLKRYREDYVNGVIPSDDGEYVLFTDACTAAARAVEEAIEKATAELRAELVRTLADAIRCRDMRSGDWRLLQDIGGHRERAERLVELGEWEVMEEHGQRLYRPVELQSSGGSDD